jgi:alkylated DNA nucleotide flippase Atl1
MASRDLNELWDIVRKIPEGCCASYGDVARSLENPVSGYTVGRWMANAPDGVPWWRVVSKDGVLVIAKKDPQAALIQRQRLEAEGIAFEGECVVMSAHRFGLLDL